MIDFKKNQWGLNIRTSGFLNLQSLNPLPQITCGFVLFIFREDKSDKLFHADVLDA